MKPLLVKFKILIMYNENWGLDIPLFAGAQLKQIKKLFKIPKMQHLELDIKNFQYQHSVCNHSVQF